MNIEENFQHAIKYLQEGKLRQAANICLEILEIQPDNSKVTHFLGIICYRLNNYDLAIECFKKTVQLNPNFTEAYNNLGTSLQEKGQFDEAISFHQKAIQLNPNFTEAYNNLGTSLQEKGQFDEAISFYQKATQLDPNFSDAYTNMGKAFQEQGQIDKALLCYQKAVQLSPSNADAHWNMAYASLLLGNFKQGWKEYEWRFRTTKKISLCRNFQQPLWDGANIRGLTILLYNEQGFGDNIQFIRYAPLVAQRGAKVIVESQKELMSLIINVEGIQQVVVQGGELPEFDIHCPLLSLPLVFDTTLENIPSKVPYIRVDSVLVKKWQDKIANNIPKFKIGLVWAGNPKFRFKSCSLGFFSPLAKLDNVVFYSLQKGEAAEQARNPPQGFKLVDYTEEINDFSDTAAFIEELDLIISVDTAVAHLAGALGKPVWTLIPFAPDWRWLLNREDSPWYPTMRLFRQTCQGDWESVKILIENELTILLKEFRTA